jgi:hypothetical protein
MSYKHYMFSEEFLDYEDAEICAQVFTDVINKLAKDYPVLVRKAVTTDNELSLKYYKVSCRFSVGSLKDAPAGIHSSAQVEMFLG